MNGPMNSKCDVVTAELDTNTVYGQLEYLNKRVEEAQTVAKEVQLILDPLLTKGWDNLDPETVGEPKVEDSLAPLVYSIREIARKVETVIAILRYTVSCLRLG